MKYKSFFVVLKELLLKQIRAIASEGESPTLTLLMQTFSESVNLTLSYNSLI